MAQVLSPINEGQNKRKVFKILQATTDELGISRSNMVEPGDKVLLSKGKQLKTAEKSKVSEKENGIAVRRSKRTAAIATCSYADYLECPEMAKTTKSVTKAVKSEAKTTKSAAKTIKSEAKTTKSAAKTTKAAAKSKKTVKFKKGSTLLKEDEPTKLNQTKLSFSPVSVATEVKENPTEIKLDNPEKCVSTNNLPEEDSGYSPSVGTPDKGPINSTAILNDVNIPISIENDISMITAENPPLHYWKSLAEQRRVALEAALHENELLYDQLTVLEAENSQLKNLVREAENLAQVLKSIVE